MKLTHPSAVALAWLACAASFASAAVQTVVDSARPGPTILLLNRPADGDVSGAVAIKQVARWPLTQGKIVAATSADAAEAIKSTSPSAIVALRVDKTSETNPPPATFAARGVDSTALREKLNQLLDPGTSDWNRGMQVFKWVASSFEIGRISSEPPRGQLMRLRPDRIVYTEHFLRRDGFAPRQIWLRNP